MPDSLWTHGVSLQVSCVHRILQAIILEWVAIPFSRRSSWPRDWTRVCCITGRFFTIWATTVSYQTTFPPCTSLFLLYDIDLKDGPEIAVLYIKIINCQKPLLGHLLLWGHFKYILQNKLYDVFLKSLFSRASCDTISPPSMLKRNDTQGNNIHILCFIIICLPTSSFSQRKSYTFPVYWSASSTLNLWRTLILGAAVHSPSPNMYLSPLFLDSQPFLRVPLLVLTY